MAGMLFGIGLMPPPEAQFALATLVQFGLGLRFYTSAWKALRGGVATMDLLVALGTSAAYGISLYLWLRSSMPMSIGHLYFESSSVVIAFVLLGKWLEERATAETASAIAALGRLRPASAKKIENGLEIDVPLETIRVGDHVLVRAGETIPVDGVIMDGAASIDESMVTGESYPLQRQKSRSSLAARQTLMDDLSLKRARSALKLCCPASFDWSLTHKPQKHLCKRLLIG